jgi:hypothetical protein
MEGLEDRRLLSGGGGNKAPGVILPAAAGTLTVVSITPGGGSTVKLTPNTIVVTFSKQVDLTSVTANSLTITGPTGVTVNLGAAIGVDDAQFPTKVAFPFQFSRAPGANANGLFTETVNAGSVVAKDGSLVQSFTDKFTLADKSSPVVTNTTLNGRLVKIFFNKGVDLSTVNSSNIQLIRAGDPAGGFNNNPNNVIVTDDPRAIISFDTVANAAIIDLSSLPQSLLPTDHYAVVVNTVQFDVNGNVTFPGVTDLVGNPLDGVFNGIFPSGSPAPTPPATKVYRNFVQDLGVRTVVAPVLNSLVLAPGSDSGIPNDNNTNVLRPTYNGSVSASFPGIGAGVTVLVEFNGLSHVNQNTGQPVPQGTFDLQIGSGGRGFVGNYDVFAVTDANGNFNVTAPSNLPNGLNRVRFLAIGQPDSPPLPGFSSIQDQSFRVDTTLPGVDTSGTHPSGASLPNNANISTLTNLSLFVTDNVQPGQLGNPLAVPTQLSFPALDPATANNLSNYSLYQVGPDAQGNYNVILKDQSAFIKSATFVSTTKRTLTNQPYTGHVDLTFSTGLPSGHYQFVAHTAAPGFSGIRDAAGNAFNGNPATPGVASDFTLAFQFQPEATYVTNLQSVSPDGSMSGPRAFYEVPSPGALARAQAPPTQFFIDFSNPLLATADYSNAIQLIGSTDPNGTAADGNFGTLGISDDGTGYTRINPFGTTVQLTNSIPGATAGQPGFNNRLLLTLPNGFSLNPDYYRIYMPNSSSTANNSTSANSAIFDQFGNQLDGEFLGNQIADGSYQDLLPNGSQRTGMSGDGTSGGAFVTGFVVVPNGNIIYAKPGAADDPYNATNAPDGSLLKPFPTLAPQAGFTQANGGDLNSSVNFGTGFNPAFDRMGAGQFHRSALYAAQVASAKGPVVVVALPGEDATDPVTGITSKGTFVLQAPAGVDSILNDGSTAIPAMTTLVLQPGTVVKLQNASLLVQNQGSALEALGGANPGQQVIFTSYSNDAVSGDSNHDTTNTTPRGGDWGGILFRNFDQTNRISTFPGQLQTTASAANNNRLKGPGGADAISGGDDVMSILNFTNVSYAGGAVPQTIGFRYDAITLQNSRPAITNDSITQTGGATGAQAAISANVDSLREDNNARGPLVRNVNFASNSINGIYIRAEVNGIAEPTNAINYPINPTTLGGQRNFTLDDPYPYVLTTPMVIGGLFLHETGGSTSTEPDRVYVQPGMLMKLSSGAGIEVLSFGQGSRQASLNVGNRTYINEFDANPNVGPVLANGQPNPNFKPNPNTDAGILFTSLFDNTASTSYFDPVTGLSTQIVAPQDSANTGPVNPNQPTPGNVTSAARWGGIQIDSSAIAVINDSTIQYGGGLVNSTGGSGGRHALQFVGATGSGSVGTGTHVSITNNNFISNADVPIDITPNGLLAADPQRPLLSGNPFMRGNVFLNNDFNGLGVEGNTRGDRETGVGTLSVNSVWDLTDLTYLVRGTINLQGSLGFGFGGGGGGVNPSETGPSPVPAPTNTLTIQSLLPGTVLADGSQISKPGESTIVKLLTLQGANFPVSAFAETTTGTIGTEAYQGAGFVIGFDNGVDPTADPLVDTGVNSSLRIVGIGANQTTGQARVPVIITSMHDQTVGTTVRGVSMNQAIRNDSTAPSGGDGGNITFGGLAATSFNLYDPRLGNIIDNADLRFLTTVQQIGGGIQRTYTTDGDTGYSTTDDVINERLGQPVNAPSLNGNVNGLNYGTQFNQPNSMTVSNSNFSTFSDIGFYAHPTYGSVGLWSAQNYPGGIARASLGGEPTNTFLTNNTFANMPIAVQISGQKLDNTVIPAPTQAVVLNNTFFNNGNGLVVNSAVATGTNSLSHVQFLSQNNIFSNSTGAAVTMTGQVYNSQGQNNLFFSNAGGNVVQNSTSGTYLGDFHSVIGDPLFVSAATGNFALTANSAAIDSARSEIGPYSLGNILTPGVTQILGSQAGIRDVNGGNQNGFGGLLSGSVTPQDYIFLPGSPLPTYVSEWVPQLAGTPGSYNGPFSNVATFNYAPTAGERDIAGNLRIDSPNKPNLGSGSSPFFDIGATEYIQVFPPHVTAVNATYTPLGGTTAITKSLYAINTVAGTNGAPDVIQFVFDHTLDPNTVNNKTVLLQASGGDGLFGNGNSTGDRFIDLSGKLSFDPSTNTMTINLGAAGLILGSDEYRIQLVGTGSQVIRDPQGNALDGENTVGGSALGAQQALPSGDNVPGGNTFVTFTIDTHPPAVDTTSKTALKFGLDAATDTNRKADQVTNNTTPTFQGTITDIFPPANFLQGQSVHIDISTKGDGVFDLIDAGVGVTDQLGNFSVAITTPLPDSPYKVGSNGYLAFDYTKTPPVAATTNTGQSLARVRIIDQAGNASNLVTDPVSAFQTANALVKFVVDTTGPSITAISPGANQVATVTPNGVPVTVTFNKNIDPLSINGGSIKVLRSGGDGIFGNANDVLVPIDPNSISIKYLGGNLGSEAVTINIIGSQANPLANDIYRVTVNGTGAAVVTDIAGNALGSSGGGTGINTTNTFVVFSPTLQHKLFVGVGYTTNPTATIGDRSRPYSTIQAAINAANIGDVVAVLPGIYNESVRLKSLTIVRSADVSSTNNIVLPGDPLQTIIRAPSGSTPSGTGASVASVTAVNLISAAGGATLNSQITGFTIASALSGNAASGPIQSGSVALDLVNADIVVDHNYIIDSNIGISETAFGATATFPRIFNNGIIGNIVGLSIDGSNVTGLTQVAQIFNNTIAFNNQGMGIIGASTSPLLVTVANNIFWQNHDLTTARAGNAIIAAVPDKALLQSNLFSGNGASQTSSADDTSNIGLGFNPAILSTTKTDNFGNFTGNPSFVSPRDPRPTADGPAVFFIDAYFGLTKNSNAIDRSNPAYSPSVDFNYSGRIVVPGKAFPAGGQYDQSVGPADVGAFEYFGVGGSPAGGNAFHIVTTSLSGSGAKLALGQSVPFNQAPASVTVNFSANVDRASVTPNDLVISGTGLSASNPAHAVSLTWVDDHTVKFNLTGGYNKSGTVMIQIPAGAVQDKQGRKNLALGDGINLIPTVGVAPLAAAAPIANVVSIPTAGKASATSNTKKKKA